MIRGDTEVIGHRAPLPRIETDVQWPRSTTTAAELARDEMWRFQREAEATRIWKLVQEACA
jgi:hypothetical protein